MLPNRIFPALLLATGLAAAADRYEAEAAIVDQSAVQRIADARASGGFYVSMKEGTLAFKVNVPSAGSYALCIGYSQPAGPEGKIQNLFVNGSSEGEIAFPYKTSLTAIKASARIKLGAGANTLEIRKSWGRVDIDYIELSPYVATPFALAGSPATPNTIRNARESAPGFSAQYHRGYLDLELTGGGAESVELYGLNGNRVANLNPGGPLGAGTHHLPVAGIGKGLYWLRVRDGVNTRSMLLQGL